MNDERQTILLVEDDPSLALGLVDSLEFEGFCVVHAKTGEEAIRLAAEQTPNCMILDVMLPDLNGYQVCQRVRETNRDVAILMLTARSQEADKIRGLDVGADDYVTKPFSVGELVARIRALLRRASRSDRREVQQPFQIGEIEIDPIGQTMKRGSATERLSFYEVELLKLLYEHVGQPVSRDDMLDRIWGLESTPSNRSVDNFIVKLRKRIEPTPDKPQHILTVYGIGYKLVV